MVRSRGQSTRTHTEGGILREHFGLRRHLLEGILAVAVAVLLADVAVVAPQADPALVKERVGNVALPFIANQGQAAKEVAFYAPTFGGTAFITTQGQIVYNLPQGQTETPGKPPHGRRGSALSQTKERGPRKG